MWIPPLICSYDSVVSNDSCDSDDCVDAEANLGLCCPHMSEETFSHSAAQFVFGVCHEKRCDKGHCTQQKSRSTSILMQSDQAFCGLNKKRGP